MRVAGYFAAADASSETLFCAVVWFGGAVCISVAVVVGGGVSIPTAAAGRRSDSTQRHLFKNINLSIPPEQLRPSIMTKPKPCIITQIDNHTINLRLKRRHNSLEDSRHGVNKNRRDARIHKELLLRPRSFGIPEACAVVGVSDGGVDAGEELLVDVDADGGRFEEVADFGVVDAAVAGEGGGGGGEACVDAAEATADEAQECAGHAGEEEDEGEGICGFHWGALVIGLDQVEPWTGGVTYISG